MPSTTPSLEELPLPNFEIATDVATAQEVIVVTSFNRDDPHIPANWTKRRKWHVFAAGIISDFNSTFGSALPSGAIGSIAEEFNVHNTVQLVLPISVYVFGFIAGPLVYGPFSESFGRKPVLLIPFIGYVAFTLGCALAPNWAAFLTFRFLCGTMASSPIAIIGGLFADVYTDEKARGKYLTWFIAVSGFGPCLAPVMSGFISMNTSWRWVFWIALIIAIITLPLIITMPETYQPVLLRQRAASIREVAQVDNVVTNSIADLRKPGDLITRVLTRPVRMFATEAIVFFCCLYLCLIYGVFYMTFQIYPLAFNHYYHMSVGITGLTFLPFGVGCLLAVWISFSWDKYLIRAQLKGDSWSFQPEVRRLPLACLGGPIWAASLFWLGWTVRPTVHWASALLSGVALGTGYLLIFIAILNYLSDAYTIYSASVQSISSTTRSITGALLPLITPHMYHELGFGWACTLLGFISISMAVIPFAFIIWGDKLRAKSHFGQKIQKLRVQGAELQATNLEEIPIKTTGPSPSDLLPKHD